MPSQQASPSIPKSYLIPVPKKVEKKRAYVQTAIGRFRRMRRPPIRHHISGETIFGFKNPIQDFVVFAGVGAID